MSLGNPICCLCFLSTLGTLFPLLHPILYASSVLFCTWFFHSFALCSVLRSVLFWLNLKKYNSLKWNHIEPKKKTTSAIIPGPRVFLIPLSTQCAQSPVDPRIFN